MSREIKKKRNNTKAERAELIAEYNNIIICKQNIKYIYIYIFLKEEGMLRWLTIGKVMSPKHIFCLFLDIFHIRLKMSCYSRD